LWSLASNISEAQQARQHWAGVAEQEWQGIYASEFGQRMSVSRSNAFQVVAELQNVARKCAQSWASAAEQQHLNVWADRAQAAEDSRNLLTRTWDDMFGDTTQLPPQPRSVEVPTPPWFEPTCDPWTY
jgi:hypothetical protein